MVQLTLILDNLRSAHNVGAILRSCDAAGVERVLACGTTPYPELKNDSRDPVVVTRNSREIAKTALGAEKTVMLEHFDDSLSAIAACRARGCTIYGLEQTPKSTNLFTANPRFPAALIVGNEVAGIAADVLAACDAVLEIPQRGSKESLNVSVAAGIAMYALCFN
ncbi:MAG TPA: RNA methyltransferase [Candidatus Saccharimonadales bacterium]|nr:RNA methyltransferase [Candidatus Saccharimonadales bacterium]